MAIMKNLNLEMPLELGSFPAWRVFKLVVITRLDGQIIEAGQTRSRRDRPARPKPPICAAKVNSSAKLTSTLSSAEAERGLSRCFARTHLSEKGISRYTCAAVATWSPVVHWKEILVIIAMTVCSLMLNGPGLRSIEEPPSQ
jgi:hypothetical protein